MDDVTLWERGWAFVERNGWGAFGFGVVFALWVLGGIDRTDDDDVYKNLPDFATPDDEIAFHEKRLKYLHELKKADKPSDALVDDLLDLVSRLQTDVSELKERQSHEYQK